LTDGDAVCALCILNSLLSRRKTGLSLAAAALKVSNFNCFQREDSTYTECWLEDSSALALRFKALDPGGGPGILEEDGGGEDMALL